MYLLFSVILSVILLMAAIYVIVLNAQENNSSPNKHLDIDTQPDASRTESSLSKRVDLSLLLPPQFIVLDLETTGLNPIKDEIIEYGAILITLGTDNHKGFHILVKPKRQIPPLITKITGITQDMVDREGATPEKALPQFIEFIQDLPLVTFNAEFDMAFLLNTAKKYDHVINNRYTCALKRARRAWPGLESYRLQDLAKLGNLPSDDSHRALGDCKRAALIFIFATEELGQKVRWTVPKK